MTCSPERLPLCRSRCTFVLRVVNRPRSFTTIGNDSLTYPFAFSQSLPFLQETQQDFLRATSHVLHRALRPCAAVRNDTLDQLLPTLTLSIRTHTRVFPGDPRPFDLSSAAEVWASTPKLPGTDAVHAANDHFGGHHDTGRRCFLPTRGVLPCL